jgi:SAM-dependent methyltransferase
MRWEFRKAGLMNSQVTHDSAAHWDTLHEQPRFRPIYPNEHVVRFLMPNRDNAHKARVLDLGAGGGRHLKLIAELGFEPYGLDISLTGLRHARETCVGVGRRPVVIKGSMLALPFGDGSFDLVISFGVFYYGTASEMKQAISELARVLRDEGKAFLVLRTTSDYRFGKGDKIEPQTFRLNIYDTNEHGTVQHFLSETDVPEYFRAFSQLSFERTEATFGGRQHANSDWLITVQK